MTFLVRTRSAVDKCLTLPITHTEVTSVRLETDPSSTLQKVTVYALVPFRKPSLVGRSHR